MSGFAQTELIGSIKTSDNKPHADALVQLLKAADSTLVKSEFTAADGKFRFADIAPGEYLIQVHSAGIPAVRKGPFQAGSAQTIDIILPAGKTLEEVQVITRKPFIERERGKVVLNVEQSINAEGSSAYEILEKAPGVRVDNNDNISLNGKPGTVVYIDGKPSPMSGAELANFLRGLGSSNIEKIELISNPSSKYDAAGSAIINIKMRKDKRSGTNGTINSFYTQGFYPKAGGGISLNHRDKKLNVYGSYNYQHRDGFTNLKLDRQFSDNGNFSGAYVQDNMLKYGYRNQVARVGVDYSANPKNTFAMVLSGVSTAFNPVGENKSDVYSQQREITSFFSTSNQSKEAWQNYGINLNYNHTIDTLGSEFTSDFDFARYLNTGLQNFTTRYYDLKRTEFARPYLLMGDLKSSLDIFALKNDLVKGFRNGLRLEAGQKSSYVVADSRASFFDQSAGVDVFDSTKSNHFIYRENINAAYASMNKDFGKWSVQAGLRMEHTGITGRQVVYDSTFRRNYYQWFPNAVITRKINEDHSAELNFSRRIRRPGYQQLNPFKFYLDPTTYREGNPYLLPQITTGVELSHIYRQKITTTIAFGRTDDNIIETIAPLQDNSRITVQTNQNLARVDVCSFNVSVPLEIAKWWYTSSSALLYYAGYTGNIANTSLKNRGNVTFNVNSSNTFNFGTLWSAEVTAFYNAREIYAYDIVRPRWFVNMGVQRKMWQGRATLRLNVNDVFFTNYMRARVDFTGYTEHFIVIRDTRQLTVSFSCKFGKSSVPGSRRRQGSAEDLRQRVGGGNG